MDIENRIVNYQRGVLKMKKGNLIIQIDCDSEKILANHYFGYRNDKSTGNNTYYRALRRFYNIFQLYGYKSTLFVVGEDLFCKEKISLLEYGLINGYEVANHSFTHPIIFKNTNEFSIEREIEMGHLKIENILGVRCAGFRAPNFEISSEVIKILNDMDYIYDCSVFPTPYTNIIRSIKNNGKYRKKNGGYLADWKYSLSPQDVYIPETCSPWRRSNKKNRGNMLNELPISVFPITKTPCHASYLLALPKKMRLHLLHRLINAYANNSVPLVYVFHLAELVEDEYLIGDEKKYYPSLMERMDFINEFCKITAERFNCMTTLQYIKEKREKENEE